MSTYYFHLGNTPDLSLYELQLVTKQTPVLITPTVAQVELDDSVAANLMSVLGGIVKIYQKLESVNSRQNEELIPTIVSHLRAMSDAKVTFGITQLGKNKIELDAADVKLALQENNVPSRYVDSDSVYGIAAAVLLKGKTVELIIINTEEEIILARTIAVQDINDWTKRDRQKPYADRKKGMLPPKVARIMVNIGLNLLNERSESTLLYDPFMGSGTILMEAAMQSVNTYGSDLDTQSVVGSRKNLEWLTEAYDLPRNFQIAQRDATQHFQLKNQPWADLIVTEPFLGKPTPKPHELPNMFKGLHRLYLGVFKNWTKQLKPGSPVVVVFPLVETGHQTFSLNNLIDKLEDLGYTNVSQPILYSRPQAIVQRQIQFFRYR